MHKQSQKRSSTENGTVPKAGLLNSPEFGLSAFDPHCFLNPSASHADTCPTRARNRQAAASTCRQLPTTVSRRLTAVQQSFNSRLANASRMQSKCFAKGSPKASRRGAGMVTVTEMVTQAKPTGNPAETEWESIGNPSDFHRKPARRHASSEHACTVTDTSLTCHTGNVSGNARVVTSPLPKRSTFVNLPLRFREYSVIRREYSRGSATVRERSRQFHSVLSSMLGAFRKHCLEHATCKGLDRCFEHPWKGLAWGLYGARIGISGAPNGVVSQEVSCMPSSFFLRNYFSSALCESAHKMRPNNPPAAQQVEGAIL